MKKQTLALPLAALALIGMTGCTAVVVPDEPQATVTLAPQDGTSTTETNPVPEDSGSQEPAQSEQAEQPAESQNSTLDLSAGDEGSEGTRYYMAEQKFSPTINSWLIEGTEVHFKQYNCTGAAVVTGTGTLEPYGEENGYLLEWDPGISVMDTQMIGDTFVITPEYMAQMNSIDTNAATPDKAAEAQEFVQMCGGLLDVVL